MILLVCCDHHVLFCFHPLFVFFLLLPPLASPSLDYRHVPVLTFSQVLGNPDSGPHTALPPFLRQGLSQAWNLLSRIDWLTSEFQGPVFGSKHHDYKYATKSGPFFKMQVLGIGSRSECFKPRTVSPLGNLKYHKMSLFITQATATSEDLSDGAWGLRRLALVFLQCQSCAHCVPHLSL